MVDAGSSLQRDWVPRSNHRAWSRTRNSFNGRLSVPTALEVVEEFLMLERWVTLLPPYFIPLLHCYNKNSFSLSLKVWDVTPLKGYWDFKWNSSLCKSFSLLGWISTSSVLHPCPRESHAYFYWLHSSCLFYCSPEVALKTLSANAKNIFWSLSNKSPKCCWIIFLLNKSFYK